jgi:putative Mn2+ efflux pump MntP
MSILKIVGGIILAVVGFYVGYQTIMQPIDSEDDVNKDNLRGKIGSFLAIVFGISLVLNGLGIV